MKTLKHQYECFWHSVHAFDCTNIKASLTKIFRKYFSWFIFFLQELKTGKAILLFSVSHLKVCQLVLLFFTMFFNIVTSWASYTCDLKRKKKVWFSFFLFRVFCFLVCFGGFFLTEFGFKVIDFNSSPTKEVFERHLSRFYIFHMKMK